ncbi:MAG TPA: hypothetical protein VK632_13365 [Verrucomicrobiae bacterium]|nr:hypothetical protein [Verrucomicrobiae bacterium]
MAGGMHRYRTDKEFSKKVLGKYGKINDEETLEGADKERQPRRPIVLFRAEPLQTDRAKRPPDNSPAPAGNFYPHDT